MNGTKEMDGTPSRLIDKTACNQLCKLVGAAELKDAAAIVSAFPGKYIPELKNAGLSIRQICRLAGILFGILRKL